MTIITTRIRGQKEEDLSQKFRSSSMDSTCSVVNDSEVRRQSSPLLLDNSAVITASLKIPVQAHSVPQTPIHPHPPAPLNLDDSDIPYIEDGSCNYTSDTLRKQQMTIGLIRTGGPTVPPRRRQRSISGSDSSQASATVYPVSGSLVQLVQQGYDSAMGSSTFSSPPHNTAPSSVSSSIAGDPPGVASWGSTPPTSPDGYHPSVNYIPDTTDVQNTPVTMQKLQIDLNSAAPVLQKVSITSTSELQQVSRQNKQDIVRSRPVLAVEHRNPISASISSIGGKVLRSKTEDFERLLNISKTESKTKSTTTSNTITEKKKYTKRRYTDSRHETRHIPDSDALEKTMPSVRSRVSVSGPSTTTGVARGSQSTQTTTAAGQVYKRRELIASVPKDRHSIL